MDFSRGRNSDGEYDDTYNETPGQTQIGRKHRGKEFLFKPKQAPKVPPHVTESKPKKTNETKAHFYINVLYDII